MSARGESEDRARDEWTASVAPAAPVVPICGLCQGSGSMGWARAVRCSECGGTGLARGPRA